MHHVALLGTGTLGESIGHRLLQQGISLKVWNRSAERCHGLHDAGATVVAGAAVSALPPHATSSRTAIALIANL